jgi:hypothetical protein
MQGALSSRSVLSMLVGTVFKKFGLFLIRGVCTSGYFTSCDVSVYPAILI